MENQNLTLGDIMKARKAKNIGDIPVGDTINGMHHEIAESIQKAQYEILDNNRSRPDLRIKAIVSLHNLEKNLWNTIGKLQNQYDME